MENERPEVLDVLGQEPARVSGGELHATPETHELRHVVRPEDTDGQPDALWLEQQPAGIELLDVGDADVSDLRAVARDDLDQTLALENPECLAHRRTADARQPGEVRLGQTSSGRLLADDDPLREPVRDGP